MPFIDMAAYADSLTIWDREATQNKVTAIYSGMEPDYVPTWERFPEMEESRRQHEIDREALKKAAFVWNQNLLHFVAGELTFTSDLKDF